MRKFFKITFWIFFITSLLYIGFEQERSPQLTISVFVPIAPLPHEQFYSLPHANNILKNEQKLFIEMPLYKARDMKLKMAEDSKNDFLCSNYPAIWFLIDKELINNDCSWDKNGWKNS